MERAALVLVFFLAAAGLIAVLSLGLNAAAPRVRHAFRRRARRGAHIVDAATYAARLRRDRRAALRRGAPPPRCRACGHSHHAWQACPELGGAA
jgi:hypothetical protein